MANELLPCPFCGGQAELNRKESSDGFVWVNCKNCSISRYDDFETDAEAIAAWNTRAPSADPGYVMVPRELRHEDKLFLIAHFEKYPATIPEPKATAWDFLHGWRALIEHIAAADTASPRKDPYVMMREALTEVMQWVLGWDPNFTYDDEWPATAAKARAALAAADTPQTGKAGENG